MELKVIDEATYNKFALKSPYISIYQVPEWGKLKETTGWKSHLVGLYDDKLLKGVTLLLEKSTPIKKSLFYAPRGFLLDVYNFKLLQEFSKLVIEYVKNNKGFMLKIDPNVIYAIRNQAGEEVEKVGEEVFRNFKKIGFKHLGFTKNFETLQPRYLCRFKLKNTYEETLNTFTKSTRKNIEKVVNAGVKVKTVDERDISMFCSLLEESADDKDFVIRPESYYKRMYELMGKYMKLYMAYIDTNLYYENLLIEYENLKKQKQKTEEEMSKVNVGKKLLTQLEQENNKLQRLEADIKEAEELKKRDYINIGALMSLFIGNESITFMSGTSSSFKKFSPKYAFYNEHIKDSINEGYEYVNFYGISGDMNPEGPYYSIYEIKKGFNPEIVELIGEFDYIINKFDYYLYKVALKGYNLLKKIK